MRKKTSRNTPAERAFKHPETQVPDFRLKDFLPISSPSQQTLHWSLTTRVEHANQQTSLMLPNASSTARIHSIARPRRSRRRRAVSTKQASIARCCILPLSRSLSTSDIPPFSFALCVNREIVGIRKLQGVMFKIDTEIWFKILKSAAKKLRLKGQVKVPMV